MEKCYYLSHHDIIAVNCIDCQRVYIGHETCEKRMPSFSDLKPILMRLKERGIKLTLLVPFLTEEGLLNAQNLIEKLSNEMAELEVASADWGLLHWLSTHPIAKPLVGRLLSGQRTDPRLHQFSYHDDLKLHLSSFSIFKKEVISYFNQLGIHRFEISDSSFQLQLPDDELNRFSLHLPYNPVAVMRWCIGPDYDFNYSDQNCPGIFCPGIFEKWQTKGDGFNFFRIDNAIYSRQNSRSDSNFHPSIDRIVINRKYSSPLISSLPMENN